jgi:hypothetical protein
MHPNPPYGDTVLFELPHRPAAAQLCRRLRSRWVVSPVEEDGQWLVFAQLRADQGDVATLLRVVEAWVAERGLEELWFQLDGRSYLLRAPFGDRPAATAA